MTLASRRIEVVDDAEDALLVAGNDARAEDDGVAGVDVGVLVVVDGGAAEGAHRFALRAADEDHQLLGRIVAHLAGIDDQALGNFDVAQVLRNLGALHHGAADDGHLAAMLAGQVEGDADAVDGRGEAGEEELLFGVRKDLVEAGNDGALAGRVAGALNVGRVLQQGQHAALAVLGKGVQVKGVAVERREVDLEVAGVDDDADRGFDGQRNAVHQRVGDADRLDGEGADGEFFLGDDLDQRGLVEQVMLFKIALDVGQGELGGVDGNLELGEDPGQAADVVHVAVGEDDGADMRLVFNQVGDIGDNDIHAQQLRLREHQPGVDHDNVVFPAEREAVHAELAEAAEGNDFQFFRLHLSDSMLTPRGTENREQRTENREQRTENSESASQLVCGAGLLTWCLGRLFRPGILPRDEWYKGSTRECSAELAAIAECCNGEGLCSSCRYFGEIFTAKNERAEAERDGI